MLQISDSVHKNVEAKDMMRDRVTNVKNILQYGEASSFFNRIPSSTFLEMEDFTFR